MGLISLKGPWGKLRDAQLAGVSRRSPRREGQAGGREGG